MKDKLLVVTRISKYLINNKYLVSIISFTLWVSFFDTFSLIDRYNSLTHLNALKKERVFFHQELDMYKQQYNELFSGKEELEKFAREQYLMKEEDEEVFLIIIP